MATIRREAITAWTYAVGVSRCYAPAYRYIVADIGVERGAWLDVGCGPGRLCVEAARGRPELDVVGIDREPAALRVAEGVRAGMLNVTLRTMDAAKIVYPEHTFDVVTAVQSAHHWADTDAILAEIWRVLRPGGRLFLYEADPEVTIPAEWVARRFGFPPDAALRLAWRRHGMDGPRWDALRARVASSPFGEDASDERHGFYRRLVCTR